MRVLGIDPGLGRTGVAVVDGRPAHLKLVFATTVETVPQTDLGGRLASLMQQVEDIIDIYKPEVASVETLLFSTNRQTAMGVAQARGVILCAIGRRRLDCVEYSPNQVKEAVAGFGGARKPQVANMTRRLLDVSTIAGPDDATDACAVAICHHHRARIGSSVVTPSHPSAHTRLDDAIAAAQARASG